MSDLKNCKIQKVPGYFLQRLGWVSDQNCKIQKVPRALFEDIFSVFFGLLNKIRGCQALPLVKTKNTRVLLTDKVDLTSKIVDISKV